MLHIILIGNNSILADAIEARFSLESDLELKRLKPCQLRNVEHAIQHDKCDVIIIEESLLELEFVNTRALLRHMQKRLLISISPDNHCLQVFQSYQISNPGMLHLVNLVRNF